MKLRFLSILLLLFSTASYGQALDSLWSVYRNTSNQDTVRLEAFNDIAWELLFTNPDSAYLLGHEELEQARAKKLIKWESKALHTIGASYQVKGNFLKAIEFYQQSMRIREKIGDLRGVASSLANIGSIYINISEFEKALYYQTKSLKTFEQLKDKAGMASAMNNIGVIYKNLDNPEKALEYNQQSLALYEEIGDKQGIAASNDNIGNIYAGQGKYSDALYYQEKSLRLATEIGDQASEAKLFAVIGRTLLKQKKVAQALESAQKGLKIAEDNEDIISEKEATSVLYEIYKEKGDTKKALDNFERFNVLKDSIAKEDTQRDINAKELQYEFEKKAAADSVKHAEEQHVKDALIHAKNAEIEQDKTQKWALFGGLLLLLISGAIMYNRFRIIRKQKHIIEIKSRETEVQKAIIEMKQKEILASISYAKRLQEAILPPASMVKNLLPDSFIVYQPKDIVAGDFYWMEKLDDWILFAAADCTGHGVPGAMVSVVCSNALNRAVKEFHIQDPGRILDKVRELVSETFEKSESEVNDGMDISLCAYHPEKKLLHWAGANNPLWIVSNGVLKEIKGTKQSIGKSEQTIAFSSHQVQLKQNDLLYLFSDGYADQFGGEKGKKFNYKNLQELLLQASRLPIEEQKEMIQKHLRDWRGNLEQVDDILLMGILIN